MKATLIMLDKPILVNDETPKYDDFMLCLDGIKQVYKCTRENFNLDNFAKSSFVYKKVLAGHEGTKRLTFNLSDEDAKRIGYVDVEKLAKDFAVKIQTKEGTISRLNATEWYKAGAETYASLTPKKYTEEQVAILIAQILDNEMAGINLGTKDYLDIINEPQQFKVECTETENEIIVTKIL